MLVLRPRCVLAATKTKQAHSGFLSVLDFRREFEVFYAVSVPSLVTSIPALRPCPFCSTQEKTTFAAIFRGGDGGGEPYLQVAQLDDGWDFTSMLLTPAQLDEMKGSEEETHAIYSVDSTSAPLVNERTGCSMFSVEIHVFIELRSVP